MAAINLDQRLYVDDAGEVGTIITMLNDDGDETEDVADAVVLIAAVGGAYVVELIEAFEFQRST